MLCEICVSYDTNCICITHSVYQQTAECVTPRHLLYSQVCQCICAATQEADDMLLLLLQTHQHRRQPDSNHTDLLINNL